MTFAPAPGLNWPRITRRMPLDDPFSKVTFLLQSGENLDFLLTKIGLVFSDPKIQAAKVRVICPPHLTSQITVKLSPFWGRVEISELRNLEKEFSTLHARPFVAYLPAETPYTPPPLDGLEALARYPLFVRPWIPPVELPENQWARLVYMAQGWVSTPALLERALDGHNALSLRPLEKITANEPWVPYFSAPTGLPGTPPTTGPKGFGKLGAQSKVLALVPHYQCEAWLGQCLDSLVRQTRPPDAIAVLDDASPQPPLEIVRKFPRITLLRSPENSGPYRMLQSAIDHAGFDAYLFQDADDWSSLDRLECLLKEAERTGAEWIGTQELMYFEDSLHALRYPLVFEKATASIRYPYCYPSSLISRDFLNRLGGFASGLRFSGDYELYTRAIYAGKVANIDRYAYFRRIRGNSLVTSAETGLSSPARKEVDTEIEKKRLENEARISKGIAPLLEPLKKAEPLRFEHLAGPPLAQA